MSSESSYNPSTDTSSSSSTVVSTHHYDSDFTSEPEYYQREYHEPEIHQPEYHQPEYHQPEYHEPEYHQPVFRVSDEKVSYAKEKIVRLLSVNVISESSMSTESEMEQNCPQYFDMISFAEYFIDDIIDEAEGIINEHVTEIPIALRAMPSKDKLTTTTQSDDFPLIMHARPQFTGWPMIREFTIELGADKIDEYLSSFSTSEEWLYIIYFLGAKTDNTSKFYEYEATWSLPSPEYPIAQATASVFFTIEVSEVIPLDCLVNVSFVFEGHHFRHTPGVIDFSEEWLNYILDSKIGVFRKIKF